MESLNNIYQQTVPDTDDYIQQIWRYPAYTVISLGLLEQYYLQTVPHTENRIKSQFCTKS